MSTEQEIRDHLGIPDDAKRVLIFAESSHWDPNWLYTSKEYFDRFVRHNLDQAIEELQQEPKRIYSVECMFFLRMYWDSYPEKRDLIRQLANEGRLRLTSSGITTADTLLPGSEAILRDFLLGQEWLRTNGIEQEPELAYFADSFGATPFLPSLLKAAGFKYTAITRMDGMYFPGCDLEPPWRFPRKGSSAEQLLKQERSLDFVWSDLNGASMLCHWNAFTYGQGDMLAYFGISRVYLARLALALRTDRHIAHRIHQYVNKLAPLSRTPYLFCPIGFDFVEPIPDLINLLNRYNRNHYPSTGIWVVNAGLDDYMALIDHYKNKLPTLELDPNPYWMGFYTSRPMLKKRCRTLVDDLLLAEKLSFLSQNKNAYITIASELKDAWWTAAVANHHDFITGTSPDRVVKAEQIPWLEQASATTKAAINHLSTKIPDENKSPGKSIHDEMWIKEDGHVHIKNEHYVLELAEEFGASIVNLTFREEQDSLLTAPSNNLISYRDSGGLWRMGLEFAGGVWKESDCASNYQVPINIYNHNDGVEIVSQIKLHEQTFIRHMYVRYDSPIIYFRVEGMAPKGYSVTVRFKTNILSNRLIMDTPGGIVKRSCHHLYNPTFWPLHRFLYIQDETTGRGLTFLQPFPGAVAYHSDGMLELVAMRNATREKVFGLIGIPGQPASGHEWEPYTFEYALWFFKDGDWQSNRLPWFAEHFIYHSPWTDARQVMLHKLTDSIVATDSPAVKVVAIKPASRGKGIIVRLQAIPVPKTPICLTISYMEVTKAFFCDARERDIKPLKLENNKIYLTIPGSIATIRLN